MLKNKEKIYKEIKELVNAFVELQEQENKRREINNNRLLLKYNERIKQDYKNKFKKKEDKKDVPK